VGVVVALAAVVVPLEPGLLLGSASEVHAQEIDPPDGDPGDPVDTGGDPVDTGGDPVDTGGDPVDTGDGDTGDGDTGDSGPPTDDSIPPDGSLPSAVDGTPNPCPSTPLQYEPDDDEPEKCVLEVQACPQSPLTGQIMRLSRPPDDVAVEFPEAVYEIVEGYDRYPEFCEERIERSAAPESYDRCDSLRGYAVKKDGNVCRIFYPISCVSGLHQHGSHTCRAVLRRSWTCEADYYPGNKFPLCFLPTEYATGEAVPACLDGAPNFGVFSADDQACEGYVGADVLRSPEGSPCSGYTTGAFPAGFTGFRQVQMVANPENRHWCQFDASLLDPRCHGPAPLPAGCSPQWSFCLKRASGTGGCDQMIETIRCRGYQAAFGRGIISAAGDVRDAGCTPCVTLPFEPSTCRDETTRASTRNHPWNHAYNRQQSILLCQSDFSGPPNVWRPSGPIRDCPDEPDESDTVCVDPPSGAVEWSSNHFSQLAVTNSPVILRIVDLPFEFGRVRFLTYQHTKGRDAIYSNLYSRNLPQYSDPDLRDRVPRQLSEIDEAGRHENLHEMVALECSFRDVPLFNVEIEELWPDEPDGREAIADLFGDGALEWWDDTLSDDARRRLTEARGLTWWADLSTRREREDERGHRRSILRSTVECHEHTLECVWRPQRPGYYRVVGVGGWPMVQANPRRWGAGQLYGGSSNRYEYRENLDDFLETQANLARLKGHLNTLGLSFGEVGMEEGPPPALRPPDTPADDWLYSEAAEGMTGCPFPIDLRVVCGGSNNAGNYTETTPVGIIVHEVRVETRPPVG